MSNGRMRLQLRIGAWLSFDYSGSVSDFFFSKTEPSSLPSASLSLDERENRR